MSLLWNTGVTQCPNKEFGCTKKFLSEEELDEHLRSCRYKAELSDVISLTKSLHVLEEKMEKMDKLGVPALTRRLEALENKSRSETAVRREGNQQELELNHIRDRLIEIEAYNTATRDDTRVSTLSKRVEQLEKTQSPGESSESEELSDKFRELKLTFRNLSNDMTQLRDTVSGGTGRKRSVLDSGAEEGVQKEISELRKKQRSDMRALGDQIDSLTLSTNNTSMELRKIRMKMNSELQVEVNEVKDKLDRVQRTCWSLEDQFAEGKGVPIREGKEGKEEKGRDVSKEVVNQLLDELGVYDSARDMDGVSVELKLLQTKVDLLEVSQRGLKLRMRSLRDHSGSQESDDRSVVTEDEGVEKLFDEIRKLKTSLAVTNTELQAGFKRVENRIEMAEGHIAETQQTTELLRYPNDSRLIRLEQSVNEIQDTRAERTADMSSYQMEAFNVDIGKRISRESDLIRKELEECQEINRDSVDVIQQKCNSLYSDCSTLNRRVEQITKQLSDKKSGHALGQDELLLHLEQGVKELQESYDSRLEQTGRQSEELSGSVEKVSRDVDQMQSRLLKLDTEVRRVYDEEGVMERVEGIEQFLQKDLPSMGLTSSQKATLEKLIEERSDTLQATLTQEIAEQVVEIRQRIPDITHVSTQVEKLESAVKSRQTSAGKETTERDLDDKMDKFQRQVRELDNNAAKIFQSLTADPNKLTPKPDTSHLNRIVNLELEIVELRDTVNRNMRQEPPKLLLRQTESLDSSVSQAGPLPDTKSAISSHALYSNTPPLSQAPPARPPHTSVPVDSYALELIRRAGERYPTSGERVMRVSRVHKVMVEQSTLLSEPFLSTQDGYQLRLQVALLSNPSGLRVKIALEIMPTDYDAKLQWPVEGSVKYYVLNQTHDFAHINLDDHFFFSQPIRTSNTSKSSILTVPNIDSNSPYCVNNTLFIRTQILNLSNVC